MLVSSSGGRLARPLDAAGFGRAATTAGGRVTLAEAGGRLARCGRKIGNPRPCLPLASQPDAGLPSQHSALDRRVLSRPGFLEGRVPPRPHHPSSDPNQPALSSGPMPWLGRAGHPGHQADRPLSPRSQPTKAASISSGCAAARRQSRCDRTSSASGSAYRRPWRQSRTDTIVGPPAPPRPGRLGGVRLCGPTLPA